MSKLTQLLRPLASAAIFYYASMWLAFLVVVGTIAQKYFGLHASLGKYFSSWLIQPMEMPIFLPGGRLTMAVIAICLATKIIIATKWKFKMLGINITHLGVLLLMIGGLITAYTTTEGNIAIKEGTSASTYSDFHALELAVTDHSPSDHDAVTTFTDGFFVGSNQTPFSDSATPATFQILHFFKNCETAEGATPQPSAVGDPKDGSHTLKAPATRIHLNEKPTDKDDRNLGGMLIRISGMSAASNGTYLLLAHPEWPALTLTSTEGATYTVNLRHRQYMLPFSIHLKDFEKLDHAGTSMARAFSSKITVTQGASSEDMKIYMNHPLRRDGFTIYQASFSQVGVETSVFQVVHNKGQIVPYIAIVIITAGLLLHVILQIPRLIVAAQSKRKIPTNPAS